MLKNTLINRIATKKIAIGSKSAMGFNELNAVENYIIHELSGVNINDSKAREPKSGYGAY